jgi:hypothetical protein
MCTNSEHYIKYILMPPIFSKLTGQTMWENPHSLKWPIVEDKSTTVYQEIFLEYARPATKLEVSTSCLF